MGRPADMGRPAAGQPPRPPPRLGTWYVWTPLDPGTGHAWCAKPIGAPVATCHGGAPEELLDATAEYTADLAARIETTSRELEQAPHRETGRRDVLERQLTAMTRLHNRAQAAPARDAPP
jgi:hypothetical protein